MFSGDKSKKHIELLFKYNKLSKRYENESIKYKINFFGQLIFKKK